MYDLYTQIIFLKEANQLLDNCLHLHTCKSTIHVSF